MKVISELVEIIKEHWEPQYYFWLVILIIFLVSRFGAKTDYISVTDIIKNHIDCFRKSSTSKILVIPVLSFLGVPILLGVSTAMVKTIDDDVINIITIIVSILTSMFFTLLTIVIDMRSKANEKKDNSEMDSQIIKTSLLEIYHTIMFEILLSVLILVLCLFNVFTEVFGLWQSALIYSFSFMLIFNLLMILKRIFRAFNKIMEK